MASEKSDIFADPMLDSDEYLAEYCNQLKKLQEQGLFPDLEKNMEYKVYSIRGSSFGFHKSIVLTSNNKHFVTVELGLMGMPDERNHIYLVTRALNADEKTNRNSSFFYINQVIRFIYTYLLD